MVYSYFIGHYIQEIYLLFIQIIKKKAADAPSCISRRSIIYNSYFS